MFGQIIDNTKANGKIIKCMVMDISYGLMEDNIKAIMLMIKNKDMDNLFGLMEELIKVIGRMVSKMVEGFIEIRKVLRRLVLGLMEKRGLGIDIILK